MPFRTFVLLFFAIYGLGVPARTMERIVATIGTDNSEYWEYGVTRYDIAFQLHLQLLNNRFGGVQNPKELLRQAQQEALTEVICLDEARRLDIKVSERDVDQAIVAIKTSSGFSDEQLVEFIRQFGFKDLREYREFLRKQLIVQRVKQVEVFSGVSVGEREIEETIQQRFRFDEKGRLLEPRFLVYRILVPLPPQVSTEMINKAFEDALRLKEAIDSGRITFEEAARKVSPGEDPKLGWFLYETLKTPLDELLKDLAVEEVSSPVVEESGIALYMVKEVQWVPAPRPQLIKRKISMILQRIKQQQALRRWLKKEARKRWLEIRLSPEDVKAILHMAREIGRAR